MVLKEFEAVVMELSPKDKYFLDRFHIKQLEVTPINNRKFKLLAKSYVGKIVLPSAKEITIKPKIKINNLLYIISYTYDLINFKYADKRKLSENDALIEIYIIVFLNWLENLFKKGLFKKYQRFTEELYSLKGKVKINESIGNQTKLVCEYSDISFSNIENQIIKATLLTIISQKIINKVERKRALLFYRRLNNIKAIPLSKNCIKQVSFNRLNQHYQPIIELCELIYNNLRLSDENGKSTFSSFMINLNVIYERFLLRALQKRLKTEYIDVTKSRKTNWAESSDNFLPQLEPDILIKEKAIVDAKYYSSPFTANDKFISGHLSQLNLYLDAYKLANGFLVYPEPDTGQVFSQNLVGNKKLNIFTVPLNKEISDLNNSLNSLANKILLT